MKKIYVIIFIILSMFLFSDTTTSKKEYSGIGEVRFLKFGCPEAPESSTCGGYFFITNDYKYNIDFQEVKDLIENNHLKLGEKVRIERYIAHEDKRKNFESKLLKIEKITPIEK